MSSLPPDLRKALDAYDPWAVKNQTSGADVLTLEHVDMTSHAFDGINLPYVNFTGATLALTDMSRMTLIENDFSKAILSGATLFKVEAEACNFSDASIDRADCRRASFDTSRFAGASLVESDLFLSNFLNCDLSNSDLQRANLCGANFSGSNLRQADLRGANVARCNFKGASLNRVQLTGARVSAESLKGALNVETYTADWLISSDETYRDVILRGDRAHQWLLENACAS